jgi:uncharacterized membrane-anchored protein
MRIPTIVRAVLAAAFLAATPAFADGPAQPTPDVAAPPIPRPAPAPVEQQPPVRAAPVPPAEPAATPAPIGQSGPISLPQSTGLALNVPSGYRFYSADEARAFLQRTNNAAPPGDILGLLAPANIQINQPDAWGTVVSFQPIGYVPSDNAGKLTDAAFEGEVRTARQAASRPFEGFALAPAFASSGPSIVWAERTLPPATQGRDLRHEIRLLGRNGVATLASVGSADQMGAMQAAAPDYLSMLQFGAGQRYADFAPSDRRADYDLPGLVTGVPLSQQNAVAEAASTDMQPATSSTSGAGLMGLFPWIAGGVAVLAGIGYMLFRGRRRDVGEPDYAEASAKDDNVTPPDEPEQKST